jgi:hypothetical protein
MEQELEMRPIAVGKGKSKAAELEQRPELERNVSSARDGKKRSKLRMGAIITALSVRQPLHIIPTPFPDRPPSPDKHFTNTLLSSPYSFRP